MAIEIDYGNVPTEIYRHLREWILRGKLRGGDRIKIDAVAEDFGVSAIPVREAMRMLAADHLIDILPRRSPVVSELPREEILEIAEIRLLLEPIALASAIPHHTPDLLDRCAAVLEQYQRIEDSWKRVDLNRDFHLMLYQPCNKRRLLKIIADQYDGLTRFSQFIVVRSASARGGGNGGGGGGSFAEHQSILQACRADDRDAAVAQLQAHLQAAIVRLRQGLESV